MGLIRSMFLKRFESSVYAFTKSLDLLMRKLLAFADKNVATARERQQLGEWKRVNADIIGFRPEQQLGFGVDPDGEGEDDSEDVVPPELADAADLLDRSDYDVSAILTEVLRDRPSGRKVLVFTEFADTARYVAKHLREAGIAGVEQLDGGSSRSRADVIRRFAPYYNGTSPSELPPGSEIRALAD